VRACHPRAGGGLGGERELFLARTSIFGNRARAGVDVFEKEAFIMSVNLPNSSQTTIGGEVRIVPSTGRATPQGPSFSAFVQQARPALQVAESVAQVLPGGPLMAAAIHGATASTPAHPATLGGVGIATRSMTASTPTASSTTSTATGTSPASSLLSTGTSSTDSGNIEDTLAESQNQNMYYLQLQERVAAQNEQFSTLSNVLKSKDDTIKNAIGNLH
jgi:hypothetical protein